MRSHGGRIRAIQTGETVIDISFIGAPTWDDYGKAWAEKATVVSFPIPS